MNWLQILHGLLIGWWIAEFIPLQNFLGKYVKPHIPNWASYIRTGLSCFKCLSFWATLIITYNFYDAIMAAVIAYSYEKFFNSLKQYF